MENALGFATLFIVSMVLAAILYTSLRKTLRNLLDDVVKLPPATTFYLRTFFVCLFFFTFSTVLDTTFMIQEGRPFMEYVWRVASGLSSFFFTISLFLLGYLLLATILVVVLRRKNDK